MEFGTGKKNLLIFLALVLIPAAVLRFWALAWGYPYVFDADAPHIVNLAVYFGSGDLNPHVFKYPTLWPYLLSASYGAYFVIGKLLGWWQNAAAFAGHFVTATADFHVVGRLVAAAASLAGVAALFRFGRVLSGAGAAFWAAGLAAFSPMLVEMAHTPKADSMLFFLSAAAFCAAVRAHREKTVASGLLLGAVIGLALSVQYTAAPLILLVPAAQMDIIAGPSDKASRVRMLKLMLAGAVSAFCAFALTSPYIFLSWKEFMSSMADMSAENRLMRAAHPYSVILPRLASNLVCFAGKGIPVLALSAAGAVVLWRRARYEVILLLVPLLAHVFILSMHPYGDWIRFLIPVFPALAVLAGIGVSRVTEKCGAACRAGVYAVLFAFPLYTSVSYCRTLSLPDTRAVAAAWIENSVKPGSTILLDQEHSSPQLPMSREQAVSLYERTKAAGHPKKKYYELLAANSSGPGYRIIRMERSAQDLESRPELIKWSNSARDVLDVSSGAESALKAAGVEYVVTTSHGVSPDRRAEYAEFFSYLGNKARLERVFTPESGRYQGPEIRVYRILPALSP